MPGSGLGRGTKLRARPNFLLHRAVLFVIVTVEAAHLAWQAFHGFGKGRHPAALNFGEYFAYALAKISSLSCSKGGGLQKTDIVSAYDERQSTARWIASVALARRDGRIRR